MVGGYPLRFYRMRVNCPDMVPLIGSAPCEVSKGQFGKEGRDEL